MLGGQPLVLDGGTLKGGHYKQALEGTIGTPVSLSLALLPGLQEMSHTHHHDILPHHTRQSRSQPSMNNGLDSET